MVLLYLPGKIIEVLKEGKDVESFDSTIVHALVEAWDDNTIIAIAQPNLNEKIKKGDFVLLEMNVPVPGLTRFIIVKILKGQAAKTIWKSFKDKLEKLKEPKAQGKPIQQTSLDIPDYNSKMIG